MRPYLVSGMAPLSSALPIGSSNLPDGNKTWNVIVNTVGANASVYTDKYTFAVSALQCAPGGCPVPPPAVLGNATMWSDPNTWGARGIPAFGEDVSARSSRSRRRARRRHPTCPSPGMQVVINGTMYVIMDVNPPKLGRVTIYGRLEFKDSAARALHCDNVVVWGALQVGSPAAPFQNSAEIVLYGNRYSPAVILNNNLFLRERRVQGGRGSCCLSVEGEGSASHSRSLPSTLLCREQDDGRARQPHDARRAACRHLDAPRCDARPRRLDAHARAVCAGRVAPR